MMAIELILLGALVLEGNAQITTTTIQDTIYNADGSVASGTILVSWPSYSTAANGTVAAGSTTATIGADGFVSFNLTPNIGATPEGTYYTVVYHLLNAAGYSAVSKEYWLVPAVAQVTISGVRTQVIPATVAVSTASKQYVDSAVAALSATYVPLIGGSMSGPLVLSADPIAAAQASTKHYVDTQIAAVVSGGFSGNDPNAIHANTSSAQSVLGALSAASLSAPNINHVLYADQFPNVQAAVTAACAASPVEMVVIPNTVAPATTSPEFSNACSAAVVDQRVAHTDVFDVRAYGAVCNGAVDDTAAIQAAIQAASSSAGQSARASAQVTLPDAVCRGNVTLPSKVSLNGRVSSRSGSSQLGSWHAGQPVITVAPGAGTVGIHDLSLYGQGGSQVMQAVSISRSAGVVTVTANGPVPTVLTVGTQVAISGVGPDTTFNGLWNVATIPTVTSGGVTSNGPSFTYSEATTLGTCARASNVVTCTTGVPLPNNAYTAFSVGSHVTVAGAADTSFNGTFVVTALGNDQGGGTNYPAAFSYAESGANATTTGGTAYPVNASIAAGFATDLGGGSGTILSAVRNNNTLGMTIAGPPNYGWAGGGQLTISGSSDSTLNGTWTITAYQPGANYIAVTNSGVNETVSAGATNNLMDKGIYIPNGFGVQVEHVSGVNFGDGLLDWEGGEVLFANQLSATTCLQDVTRQTVQQLPWYPPVGGSNITALNPMGCVVLNGTDGYMEYSEISTGSTATSGTISVVNATLPSKAIVNGWGGINNWFQSNIGELSDEGIWSGGQFNRWYMNRADLNAGTGIEDQSNSSVWMGNMALHDGSDQVVSPGGWYGIYESGSGENVLGANVWTGNSVLEAAPLAADIYDGRSSGSGTPNVWTGNFAQTFATPAGYSSSFSFADNDFKQTLTPFTGLLGGNVSGLHNVTLQGSSAGQVIGNFAGGVPGQHIHVLSYDGNTTMAPGSGYALHTCSGYPFTPMAQNGTTGFTLQGDYEMAWQMDCAQVAPWQLEGHGSLALLQTANPTTAAVVVVNGTAGTASYSYVCTQVNYQGVETLPTPVGSTSTGNATLSATNNNTVYCPPTSGTGLLYQKAYRTAVPAGSGLAPGFIGTTALVGYNGMTDSGQAVLNSSLPPKVNHTADLSTQGAVSGATLTVGGGTVVTSSSNLAQVGQSNTFAVAQTFGGGLSAGSSGQTLLDGLGNITATGTSKLANVIAAGPRVDVRYYGAIGDGVTDNCTAITTAAAAAAGSTLFIPGGTFVTSCALTLPVNTSLFIDPNGVLQAKTGSTMAAVVIAGGTTAGQYWTDQVISGGGTIDANNAATRVLWLRQQVRGKIHAISLLNAAGAACVQNGDTADGLTGSNSLDTIDMRCYRTSGAIVAGSYGIWTDNATDSKYAQGWVKGYATAIRDDVGGSRYTLIHVWDTNTNGAMTTCFDDNGQSNWWDNNVCDSPTTYGAVIRQYNSHWNNNRFELNNTYNTTNTATGIYSVNADPTSFIVGNEFTSTTPNGAMKWMLETNIIPVANMNTEFIANRNTEVTTSNIGTNDYFRSTNSFGSFKGFAAFYFGSADVLSGTATPTFSLKASNIQKYTLAANSTSQTWTSSGALQNFIGQFCQNSTGGYTYTNAGTYVPTGLPAIGLTASTCSFQSFYDTGTGIYAVAPMMLNNGVDMGIVRTAYLPKVATVDLSSNNSGNSDLAGNLAIASGTSTTYTFANTAHTVVPIAVCSDTSSSPTACSAIATVTALTIYGTAAHTYNYHVIFRDLN